MYILNTTFIVTDARLDSFIAWARSVYIPALSDNPAFSAPTMAKVLHQVEPGATSIAIQTMAGTFEEATRWHDETAALLRDDMRARFGEQVLFFTTYMEVMR